MKVYERLAAVLKARMGCKEAGNSEWLDRHDRTLEHIMKLFPSGSGFNCGTELDPEAVDPDKKLVLTADYHAMDENGYYDGWHSFRITVTPSLIHGFNTRVGCPDRDLERKRPGLRDYVRDCFDSALMRECPEDLSNGVRYSKEGGL